MGITMMGLRMGMMGLTTIGITMASEMLGLTMMSLTSLRMGVMKARHGAGVVLNAVGLSVAVWCAGFGQAQVSVPIMWIVMVTLLTPKACGQRGS